jgi:hypothetical protein
MSQLSTISNTTLFLYKHVKIADISKCPLYQNTTHFLHKHVTTVHYIIHYTFPMQNCQNCVHIQLSTISHTTLFCTNTSQLSTISITTLLLHKIAKIAFIYKCPLYKSTTLLLYKFHFFTFLMKVYLKSTNLRISCSLDNFPNESLYQINKFAHFLFFWPLS